MHFSDGGIVGLQLPRPLGGEQPPYGGRRVLVKSLSLPRAKGPPGIVPSSSSTAAAPAPRVPGALAVRGPSSQQLVAVKVTVSAGFASRVRVEVPGAQPEGDALPEMCGAGTASAATYCVPAASRGSETRGELLLDDFEPVPFGVGHDGKTASFVGLPGRRRWTALRAEPWNWRDASAEKPSEGWAADLEVSGALLSVRLRAATAPELKRCLQLQALREAERGQDYDTLHAQVAKAKLAGVDAELIERGEVRLRALQKQGLHVNEGCDKESLCEEMQWSKVTRRLGEPERVDECQQSSCCPCNTHEGCGEEISIAAGAVQDVLGEGGDEALFRELLDAALAVKEGSVWKAGGKYIFSAFSRNQSVIAMTRYLEGAGRKTCADMLLKLVKRAEEQYGGFVTAAQVNFHPNGSTFHDQHRDIYSAKQRAGPNCACSFRECVGTVCYSLGSSRVCQLETMVDDQSAISSCGASCEGRRERRWLHSGDAMYFNIAFNQNHTHGIPAMEEATGPRISIAFLLGAPDFSIKPDFGVS